MHAHGRDISAARITTLQHLLGAHGHPVAVDGIWGPETSGAVSAYQASAGLEADSIPGPATLGALADVVSQGSTGGAVSAVQAVVGVVVDGDFGPATHAAVVAFQSSRGLDADGVVGVLTWTALFNGGGEAPPPPPEDPPSPEEPVPEPEEPTPTPEEPTPPPSEEPTPPPPEVVTYGNGRCPDGQGGVSLGIPATGNGCGSPSGGTGWVPELWYHDCCDGHDICYSDCTKSKGDCHIAFLTCMRKSCDDQFGNIAEAQMHESCMAGTAVYYAGVALRGGDAFETGTKTHCKCF